MRTNCEKLYNTGIVIISHNFSSIGVLRSVHGKIHQHVLPHFSDAIRMILIYRFGGWYSDLDVVFLRPLLDENKEPLKNVVASDSLSYDLYDDPKYKNNYGESVANGFFHNDKGHVFLENAIQLFATTFNPEVWGSSGPQVFLQAMEEVCGKQIIKQFNPDIHNRHRCCGMTIVEPRAFYPVGWFHASQLFTRQKTEYWNNLFSKSYSVHFYGSSSKIGGKILKPKFYGPENPAYLNLGVHHCPDSFFSDRLF